MKWYQIAELEQLTGIKAHTIRIWEKRYKLIEPDRTSTNIRRYDDNQVKKLLNVATLLSQGYKISKIAELKDKELGEKILAARQSGTSDVICLSFINEMAAAMLNFDEINFERTFSNVVNRFGMFDAMLKVVYPLLHKIGIMWSVNDAMPVQEHFASGIIRRKLMAATDGLPLPDKKKKKFLLFLPPDEYHEIALLFANFIIRAKGCETIYLGQNVPLSNIKTIARDLNPDFFVTFFITGRESAHVSDLRDALRSADGTLLVSGTPEILSPVRRSKNLAVLEQPSDLLAYLP